MTGDLEVPVSIGVYQWVMSAGPGRVDPLATGILVTVIVVIVVAVFISVPQPVQ